MTTTAAITVQDYERVCAISLAGDLSGDDAPAVARAAVDEAIAKRQIVDFVVDFAGCGFIDSSGLEALLAIKRHCEELFGRVKLINLDEHCRKILEVTRLESRFECCRDLATALKTMR